MSSDTFVEAEGVMHDYLNSLTGTLVGAGKPLRKGVVLRLLRSPGEATCAVVSRIGGYEDEGEARIDNARMSFMVYGPTKQAAANAAVALMNALRGLVGVQQVVGAARILTTDEFSGPTYTPDEGVERYLVDCTVLMQLV